MEITYCVCCSWQWSSLHWSSFIATVIPQHNLAWICTTHNQIWMKFCKRRRHNGWLQISLKSPSSRLEEPRTPDSQKTVRQLRILWEDPGGLHRGRDPLRLSDFTFTFHFSLSCTGEGNGNPLLCSCLENPKDGGAWWAAVYGVAQSWTQLKRFSSRIWLNDI